VTASRLAALQWTRTEQTAFPQSALFGTRVLAASSAWPPAALWVSLGILGPSELAELRASGLAVTNFITPIDPSNSVALANAVNTIREHHPGQAVWVDGSAVA